MSTHYETLPHAETYREAFAVEPTEALGERHLWPRKPGFFIVHATTDADISQPAVAKATPDVETNALADAPTEVPGPSTERVTSERPKRPR